MAEIPSQGMAFELLGEKIAQEVLKEYADLLRVGRLTVNGVIVRWRVHGNNARALDCFLSAFKARVNMIFPDLEDWGMFAYTVLKAISINFALYEVTEYIRSALETENMITILTYSSASKQQILEYGVHLYYTDEQTTTNRSGAAASSRSAHGKGGAQSHGFAMSPHAGAQAASGADRFAPSPAGLSHAMPHASPGPINSMPSSYSGGWVVGVSIDFLTNDNILECDKKGKPRVRGTMRCIRAAFPYPAPAHFRPSYEVECDLKKRWGKRFLSSAQDNADIVVSNELGPQKRMSDSSVVSAGSGAKPGREGSSGSQGKAAARSAAFNRAAAKMLHWTPFGKKGKDGFDLTAGIKGQVLGELVLEILHAEGLQALGDCNPFIIVTLGNEKRNTSVVRDTSKPEWKNTFRLPINRYSARTAIDMTVWNSESSPRNSAIENSEFLGQAFLDVDHGMMCTTPTVMQLELRGIDSAAKRILEKMRATRAYSVLPEGTDATVFYKSPTGKDGIDEAGLEQSNGDAIKERRKFASARSDTLRRGMGSVSIDQGTSPTNKNKILLPHDEDSMMMPSFSQPDQPQDDKPIRTPLTPGATSSTGYASGGRQSIDSKGGDIEQVVSMEPRLTLPGVDRNHGVDAITGRVSVEPTASPMKRAGAHDNFIHEILPAPQLYIRVHFTPASPTSMDAPPAEVPKLPSEPSLISKEEWHKLHTLELEVDPDDDESSDEESPGRFTSNARQASKKNQRFV